MSKKTFLLYITFCLALPMGAQAFDLSLYGSTSCEFGQCMVTVPADSASKASCDRAFAAVYNELNRRGRLITNTTPCYDTTVKFDSTTGRERVVHIGSFSGAVAFVSETAPNLSMFFKFDVNSTLTKPNFSAYRRNIYEIFYLCGLMLTGVNSFASSVCIGAKGIYGDDKSEVYCDGKLSWKFDTNEKYYQQLSLNMKKLKDQGYKLQNRDRRRSGSLDELFLRERIDFFSRNQRCGGNESRYSRQSSQELQCLKKQGQRA